MLLVPVYRGLYGYPEQRGMDGTSWSPFQRMVKAKEKVRHPCVIICKHLEIFREPGMGLLNVTTHLLWMILVRERTLSCTPKPVHSMLSDSDKVTVLLGMCPPPHLLGRWICDHEFWVKLEIMVTWLLLLPLMTSTISPAAVHSLRCCFSLHESQLILRSPSVKNETEARY